MPSYEYKVVPAPTKGLKAKGVKTPEARFSNAIETMMNDLAGDGWEYQRAETLPSIERSGLTSSTTEWRNVLVFRRARQDDTDAFAPELLPAPAAAPMPAPAAEAPASEDAAEPTTPEPSAEKTTAPASDATAEKDAAEKPPLVATRND